MSTVGIDVSGVVRKFSEKSLARVLPAWSRIPSGPPRTVTTWAWSGVSACAGRIRSTVLPASKKAVIGTSTVSFHRVITPDASEAGSMVLSNVIVGSARRATEAVPVAGSLLPTVGGVPSDPAVKENTVPMLRALPLRSVRAPAPLATVTVYDVPDSSELCGIRRRVRWSPLSSVVNGTGVAPPSTIWTALAVTDAGSSDSEKRSVGSNAGDMLTAPVSGQVACRIGTARSVAVVKSTDQRLASALPTRSVMPLPSSSSV